MAALATPPPPPPPPSPQPPGGLSPSPPPPSPPTGGGGGGGGCATATTFEGEWVESSAAGDGWCGAGDTKQHYSSGHRLLLDAAGITGVGGTNFKFNTKQGWRLAKTNLEQCKEACGIIGCAEMSVEKSGKICYMSKTRCAGNKLNAPKWIKYHRNTNNDWVTQPGSSWCGKSHNQGDYAGRDRVVLEKFALSGVGGSNFKLVGSGWRLAKSSLEQCKEACDLIGCAEMHVAKNGKTCFLAKTRCDGNTLPAGPKWTKYVLNAPGCASSDQRAPASRARLDCVAVCARERRLQAQSRSPLFATLPAMPHVPSVSYASENLPEGGAMTARAGGLSDRARCGCV